MANCDAMKMGKADSFSKSKPSGLLRVTTKPGGTQVGKGYGHEAGFNPNLKQERTEKAHSSRKD